MKKEIQILLEFGELLSQVRSQLNIRVDLLTADLHASQRVYSRVWKGEDATISNYLRVYRYLWQEATPPLRRQMDDFLLRLFHPEE